MSPVPQPGTWSNGTWLTGQRNHTSEGHTRTRHLVHTYVVALHAHGWFFACFNVPINTHRRPHVFKPNYSLQCTFNGYRHHVKCIRRGTVRRWRRPSRTLCFWLEKPLTLQSIHASRPLLRQDNVQQSRWLQLENNGLPSCDQQIFTLYLWMAILCVNELPHCVTLCMHARNSVNHCDCSTAATCAPYTRCRHARYHLNVSFWHKRCHF